MTELLDPRDDKPPTLATGGRSGGGIVTSAPGAASWWRPQLGRNDDGAHKRRSRSRTVGRTGGGCAVNSDGGVGGGSCVGPTRMAAYGGGRCREQDAVAGGGGSTVAKRWRCGNVRACGGGEGGCGGG